MARFLFAGALSVSMVLLATMAAARLGRGYEGHSLLDHERGGIAGYDRALRPSAELWAALQGHRSIPAGEDQVEGQVKALNRLVFESLAHGDPAPIAFRENWIAWAAGLLFQDLARPQAPGRIARGGRGLCHDAVAVLITLATRSGFEARMLDLEGHVVAIIEKDGRSWVADPDYGLVFPGTADDLAQPEGLRRVRESVRSAGHGARYEDAYVAALVTTADNRIIPGARLSPRLARLERFLDRLAWGIPGMILAALGWREWRRRARLRG